MNAIDTMVDNLNQYIKNGGVIEGMDDLLSSIRPVVGKDLRDIVSGGKLVTSPLRARGSVTAALSQAGWFEEPGAYVLVDGQYGSTGKGLLAAILAEYGYQQFSHVTTNAGPNSGHTAYSPLTGRKIVTQQIPVAGVIGYTLGGDRIEVRLNAGAIIDPSILIREQQQFGTPVRIHPHAACISAEDVEAENIGAPSRIASTGKGVGSALARKTMRDPTAVVNCSYPHGFAWNWKQDVVFVETAQGFSLGINSGFYPATTSRECTVQQALSDAHIPARRLRKVAACYRTYPIRVGNTAVGNSGGCYTDQQETTWEDLGLEPELTTVTKRVRRVFTWSRQQFRHSVRVNEPDLIFINFMNYLRPDQEKAFLEQLDEDYRHVMGRSPETILVGYGPRNGNVGVATFVDGSMYGVY